MQDVVIFGAGKIAEVAKYYLDRYSQFRVVGFTVDAAFKTADTFADLPLVAWEELTAHFPPGSVKLLGPLSYQRLNEFRQERYFEGKRRGYDFVSFVHPATQNNAEIGDNCFILENCVLQPFARIGNGVIIWSATHVGHHCVIDDFCFLSTNVGLGGGVRIGARCFLGGKVGVETGSSVGADCFIGSKALVKKDLAADSVVPGPHGDRIARYKSSRIRQLRFK